MDPPRLEKREKSLPLALGKMVLGMFINIILYIITGAVSFAILLILVIHGLVILILWHRRKRKVGGELPNLLVKTHGRNMVPF